MLSPTTLLAPPIPPPPEGVRMSGLRSDPSAERLSELLFALVDISQDVPIPELAGWLEKRINHHRPVRFRINGREPMSRTDFERILTEELAKG